MMFKNENRSVRCWDSACVSLWGFFPPKTVFNVVRMSSFPFQNLHFFMSEGGKEPSSE